MLKNTQFDDTDKDSICDRSGRFFAFKMPGGGWMVRDLHNEFNYEGPGDRVATVEEADELIGLWLTNLRK